MKKKMIWVNILLIIAVVLSDIRYAIYGSLLRKAITSIGFVLLGLINAVWAIKADPKGKGYALTMLAGLFFAMLGDILLGPNFFVGVEAFALGHVLYAAAYGVRRKFVWKDLPACAAMFGIAMCILNNPGFVFDDSMMKIACHVYAVIISVMVGKAVTNLICERSATNWTLAVGSMLFYFSDVMLVWAWFGNAPKIADYLCLGTYYPAQLMLALSIYLSGRENDA